MLIIKLIIFVLNYNLKIFFKKKPSNKFLIFKKFLIMILNSLNKFCKFTFSYLLKSYLKNKFLIPYKYV